jgi:hypothetical protein
LTLKSKFPLVLIEWSDSYGYGGEWQAIKRAKVDRASIHSVGWVLDDTDEGILLVQSVDEEGAYLNSLVIPRGTITRRTELRP